MNGNGLARNEKEGVRQALDFMARVEHDEVSVAALCTVGRSGSTLVHSFLDGHPNVLLMPTMFPFYVDWLCGSQSLDGDIDALVDNYVFQGSFARSWFKECLGENRKESLQLPLPGIAKMAKAILRARGETGSRALLLALHCAYALVSGQSLSEVSCLVFHHHYMLSDFLLDFRRNPLQISFSADSRVREQALNDFPSLKVIYTIRHPYALAASALNHLAYEREPVDLSRFFSQLQGLAYNLKSLSILEQELPGRLFQIQFEQIHLQTGKTLKELAEFLGISWHECLLKSTIDGWLWWGNNPQNPLNGPNPDMAAENWHALPEDLLVLIRSVTAKCGVGHGYDLSHDEAPENPAFCQVELQAYFDILLRPLENPNQLLVLPESEKAAFVNHYWQQRATLLGLKPEPGLSWDGKRVVFLREYDKVLESASSNTLNVFVQPWGDKTLQLQHVIEMKARGCDVWLRDDELVRKIGDRADCLFIPYFAIPGKVSDEVSRQGILAIGRGDYVVPTELTEEKASIIRLDQLDGILAVENWDLFRDINPYHYQAQWNQLLAGFCYVYLDDVEDPWQIELGLTAQLQGCRIVKREQTSFYFDDTNSLSACGFKLDGKGQDLTAKAIMQWDGVYRTLLERLDGWVNSRQI